MDFANTIKIFIPCSSVEKWTVTIDVWHGWALFRNVATHWITLRFSWAALSDVHGILRVDSLLLLNNGVKLTLGNISDWRITLSWLTKWTSRNSFVIGTMQEIVPGLLGLMVNLGGLIWHHLSGWQSCPKTHG